MQQGNNAQISGQADPRVVPSSHPIDLNRILNFQHVSDLGAGNFGVARLMLDKSTNGLVAVKFIERGDKIDRNVEREIINHCMLRHPHIVGFKEVFLTPTHLAIVMEYAAGGELFERIVRAGKFTEDEARYFFQQLISGVDYCHQSGICHRDLKLENTLLDSNPAPRLKICDFGYSKSALDSQPKSTVGTPAYIAPEVLQRKEYDGKTADVWSCGVTLFVMLVGAYPFEDPTDPRNFRKTITRIMEVSYSIPDHVTISQDCRDLLSRIFVAPPVQRITMAQIKQHPWFKKNLPAELTEPSRYVINTPPPTQSQEEIRALIKAARTRSLISAAAQGGSLDLTEDGEMMADDLDDTIPAHQQQQPVARAPPVPTAAQRLAIMQVIMPQQQQQQQGQPMAQQQQAAQYVQQRPQLVQLIGTQHQVLAYPGQHQYVGMQPRYVAQPATHRGVVAQHTQRPAHQYVQQPAQTVFVHTAAQHSQARQEGRQFAQQHQALQDPGTGVMYPMPFTVPPNRYQLG